MAKKALLVGINDYPDHYNDLRGCVNDANAWAKLLADHFNFPKSAISLLTDEAATKAGVMKGLKALLAGAKAGDTLVFANSSHGSQVPEKGGDEKKYDEVLCPYDTQENPIVDDELRELFSATPSGVRLTVILDNCHSGSGTRKQKRPDEWIRKRYLPPAFAGAPKNWDPDKATKATPAYPQSGMKEILLAGCTSTESSYDASLGGTYHGALTYHAIRAIEAANYKITYAELGKRVHEAVSASFPDQHPQLEGSEANKKGQVFA